ncbi:hypothetical protein H0H87_003425, partial [Tephrocybe sp. NHM501043]
MLKDTKVSPDFPITTLAAQCQGCSGSDLKELCRNAAMIPVREYIRSTGGQPEILEKGQNEEGFNIRALTLSDFFAADGTSPLPPLESEYDETRL